MGLLGKATPGEWPQPTPSRFNTDHWIVERPSAPHIAAIKRREDANAAVAAVNYLRSHGEAIRELVEKACPIAAVADDYDEIKHDDDLTDPHITFGMVRALRAALAKFPEPRP
jgi:hypothetical protein